MTLSLTKLIIGNFDSIHSTLSQIQPSTERTNFRAYKVIHITHYIQMFGFSIGIVTAVASYILNEKPILVASCVLVFTTGCALIGMKDLPYLKSLEQYTSIILKRVQKIHGFVKTLKDTNAKLDKRIPKIHDITEKYGEITSQGISAKKKFGKDLKTTNAELAEALASMKKLQLQNQQLEKQIREAQQQAQESNRSFDSFKKHQKELSTTTDQLTEITFKAERTTTALQTENASLGNNVQRTDQLLEEAKNQTTKLQNTIFQTDKTVKDHFDISKKADQETQIVLTDTKKAVFEAQSVIEQAKAAILLKQNRGKKENANNINS